MFICSYCTRSLPNSKMYKTSLHKGKRVDVCRECHKKKRIKRVAKTEPELNYSIYDIEILEEFKLTLEE